MDEKMKTKMSKIIAQAKNLVQGQIDLYNHVQGNISLKQIIPIKFCGFSLAYSFTTENINGYFKDLDMENKDILTVVGSGDHIFCSILKGAKKIDAFDISNIAILAYYLKEAAIKTLDYEEFVTYYFAEKFDLETYKKIRVALNKDALVFWDQLYESYPQNIKFLFSKPALDFYSDNPLKRAEVYSQICPYLKKENYDKLKAKLEHCEIRCFNRSVNKLDNIGENYDYILLSNILQYQQGDDFLKFKDSVCRYINKLNAAGEMKIGYVYDHLVDGDESSLKLVDSLGIEGVEIIEIPAYYFTLFTPTAVFVSDNVLSYKKR